MLRKKLSAKATVYSYRKYIRNDKIFEKHGNDFKSVINIEEIHNQSNMGKY